MPPKAKAGCHKAPQRRAVHRPVGRRKCLTAGEANDHVDGGDGHREQHDRETAFEELHEGDLMPELLADIGRSDRR